MPTRLLAGLAILVLVACGTAGEGPVAGGQPKGPDEPVPSSPTPGDSAGSRGRRLVVPKPGMDEVRPLRWQSVRTIDPRTLMVRFTSGVEPCYVLDHVDVEYGSKHVAITLFEGQQCNDQGASLALIKLSDGKIIGGYNPLGWMKIDPRDKNDYSKSFLLSFEPNLDIRSLKSVSVKNPNFAFNNQSQPALHFGTTDLIVNGQNGSCVVKDFQSPIVNTQNFNVENIEVFAVKMKQEKKK